MKILVTGSGGQLGSEIQDLISQFPSFKFTFSDYPEMDITDKESLGVAFAEGQFDYCINCAAFTAVDKAEEDKEKCDAINVTGSKNLAELCQEHNVTLFHISTDFVFDGTSCKPLKEDQPTAPVNYYGVSKLNGEHEVTSALTKYFIFRTSWLYSTFGNNFVKTMIKLSESRDELNIIVDQIGSPTYARDLALSILEIIDSGSEEYGLYHYSNQGVASWYDFTCAIFEYKSIGTKVHPIPTEKYPTLAARPHYSVMDKSKFEEIFQKNIPHWRDSLKSCLQAL